MPYFLSFDRITNERVTHEKECREAEVSLLTDLRLFSDNSSLEIFVNDGDLVFSLLYFTEEANVRVSYAGLKPDGIC
ncbi:GH32 C-terminal domain-containing protein [Paenibacillus sp. Sa2BVA9]|uniref:GH32 C-terminal domain-containing protein n=2 Tax=Paenibacillus gallinarum TaxID=2762232 RepID=A0ABR8T5Q2_9BACL|nr:GH32 C-terminal domain-containing protein [Paenibacillus gallinarum]